MSSAPFPSLRLLGPMQVVRAGQPVPLPKSQKTRALLAYLAVTGREHRREHLCRLLWDVTDDPRASLRWSLSKLRVLDDDNARRIVADRETVAFAPRGAEVDALEVESALSAGVDNLSLDRMQQLADMFRGGFLEELELPDFEAFQAFRVAQRERFRTMHAQLLRALSAGHEAQGHVEAALLPARALVRLLPDDPEARAGLIRLLGATGREEEAAEHYDLGRKQLQRAGRDDTAVRDAFRNLAAGHPAPAQTAQAVAPGHAAPESQQQVRLCTAPDGVRIAFATLGEGPPLVKTANWLSHLEFDWKSPLWRHLARELASEHRLVRYDQRGCGLSDWEVSDYSLDAYVGDLAAVMDAAGLARAPLLGISQGCRVAVAFAARYPDRVSHLVLYGGGARGWKHRPAATRETRAGLQSLIREGWARDIPAFRQVFTTLFMPDATPEQANWFNELQRVSTSAENADRITAAAGDTDVTGLLDQVRAPTLVMHAIDDAMVPFEEGRILAAGIQGARFVALQSSNHLLLDDEPAFARFLWEIRDFLA